MKQILATQRSIHDLDEACFLVDAIVACCENHISTLAMRIMKMICSRKLRTWYRLTYVNAQRRRVSV